VPGAPGPAPLMVKLRAGDHAPCWNALLTAWARQKYVPFARPLTTSCVWPFVEFWRITVVKLDEALTCQLYPRIPLGSLTADQEIVNGTWTVAPSAGARSPGAGGAAAARPTNAMLAMTMDRNRRESLLFIIS